MCRRGAFVWKVCCVLGRMAFVALPHLYLSHKMLPLYPFLVVVCSQRGWFNWTVCVLYVPLWSVQWTKHPLMGAQQLYPICVSRMRNCLPTLPLLSSVGFSLLFVLLTFGVFLPSSFVFQGHIKAACRLRKHNVRSGFENGRYDRDPFIFHATKHHFLYGYNSNCVSFMRKFLPLYPQNMEQLFGGTPGHQRSLSRISALQFIVFFLGAGWISCIKGKPSSSYSSICYFLANNWLWF